MNTQLMQELHCKRHKSPVVIIPAMITGVTHQSAESAEGSGYPEMRVYLYENVLGGVYVHLQHPCPVEWTVQQHHETLVGDVWPRRGNVATVLRQLLLMIIAVQQLKLSSNLTGQDEMCNHRVGMFLTFTVSKDASSKTIISLFPVVFSARVLGIFFGFPSSSSS